MTRRRVEPDDDVFHYKSVFIGPTPYTLWWQARYIAYGVFFVVFIGILTFEAITPLRIGLPPVWEFVISILATRVVMAGVDSDRTVTAIVTTAFRGVYHPRRIDPATRLQVAPTLGRTVKTTKDPL